MPASDDRLDLEDLLEQLHKERFRNRLDELRQITKDLNNPDPSTRTLARWALAKFEAMEEQIQTDRLKDALKLRARKGGKSRKRSRRDSRLIDTVKTEWRRLEKRGFPEMVRVELIRKQLENNHCECTEHSCRLGHFNLVSVQVIREIVAPLRILPKKVKG